MSKGTVVNWLAEENKKTSGNKIVTDNKPKETPATKSEAADSATGSDDTTPLLEVVGNTPEADYERFNAMIRLHTAIEGKVAELGPNEVARAIMFEKAERYGFPFKRNVRVEDGNEVPYYTWPVIETFAQMLDEMAFAYKQAIMPKEVDPAPEQPVA